MEPNTLDGEALVAAHKSAMRKLRIISVAFPLVMIAIIVGYLAAIAAQIRAVDTTVVATESAQRLSAAWPELEGHLSDVAKKIEPVYASALDKETQAMAPLLEERLQKDVERTLSSAEASFTAELERSITSMEAEQRRTLAKVPELAADGVAEAEVLGAARQTLATWSDQRFHQALDEHVRAMEAIRMTLEQGYSDKGANGGDPKAALTAWFELLNQQVGGEGLIAMADARNNAAKTAGARPEPKTKQAAPSAAGSK